MLSPAVEAFRARSTGVLDRVRPWWIEPWVPLGILALLQWLLVIRLALTAQHNGWLFYQGGDETFLYSSSWIVAHGHLPDAAVGWLWPMVLAPISALSGPNFVSGLPLVILFQVVILLPLGLVAIYGCGSRIGGRVVGYLAAAIWVLAPHLTTGLFTSDYHEKWVSLTLPQALGLSGMGDFPSMVLLACAAWFVLRTIDGGRGVDAVIAAVLVGLAIGLKPANALVLGGIAPGLLIARRWRGTLLFGAALVPAVLTLVLWKERGLGNLPLFSSAPAVRLAAGATLAGAAPVAGLNTYLHLNWHSYGQTIVDLREVFWSRRLLEFLPLAGVVAIARSSFAKTAFVGGWFFTFFLLKVPRASVDDASIWRLLTPAWPAFLLLIAALPLLLPGVGGKLVRASKALSGGPIRFTRGLTIALGAVTVIPLLVVLALAPLKNQTAARLEDLDLYVPQDTSIKLDAVERNGAVQLSWKGGGSGNAKGFYRVLRERPVSDVLTGSPPFPKAHDGLLCHQVQQSGSMVHIPLSRCTLHMDDIGGTAKHTWTDHPPAGGKWVYRVEAAANWVNDATKTDPFTFSRPVTVTVRP
jgi:hypothetical protein